MRKNTLSAQRGFSLVEILVGMVVGLVITIIIYQVVATNEGMKRSTTSGADAQQNGMFSLSAIERDIRGAGWGMPSADVMRCGASYTYMDDGSASGPVPNFPQGPLRIIDGGTGAGASDTITLLWGSSVRANVRNLLLQNVVANPADGAAAALQPLSKVGMSGTGGFVWLADDVGACALARITASVPNPAQPDSVLLSHEPATGSAAAPSYNPPSNYMSAQGWPANYSGTPRIYDLGALLQRSYSVVGGSLMAQEYFSSNALVQVANNVVALKAWYGISDAGSQVVNNWVSATNGAGGNWALPTPDDTRRIKAVRLAVVVRSSLKERPAADGSCSITTVAPQSWIGGPAIDLGNDPDWRCYRYRSFETVVPLRNVLWANLS